MLEQMLKSLAKSTNIYPFHMPGHKRMMERDIPNPYSIDITEIEGFDNLHHAEGILKSEQMRAAELYGSKQCYYLVNGSTCGLLAAVSAAVKRGGKILIARNCHRAVYHACYLRQLTPVYVYPVDTKSGLQGQILACDIEEKLKEHGDIGAVVITSPTYDGIVSDVAAIAKAAHEHGIPLIVDEAHGAHFGFHKAFPENATRLGADAVVMSIHKTLPAYTQTALLHLCSGRIEAEAAARFLAVYETSSPSYVLMDGISRCVRIMGLKTTEDRINDYVKKLDKFYDRVNALKHIRVLRAEDFSRREAFAFDIGKLIIMTEGSGIGGLRLKEQLLSLYSLQTEMANCSYVLAMTSFMDSPRGFDRLASALLALDDRCTPPEWEEILAPVDIYREQERCMELCDAWDAAREEIPLSGAEDRICADFVYLYPPGVPILVPGERITEWTLLDIEECLKNGLQIEGLGPSGGIEVVKKTNL